MPSTKPYLLRAMYEWAEDSLFTPQVLVNAGVDGVLVPQGHVVDGQIVLNVSGSAVKMHSMDNDAWSFSARFNGKEEHIYLPMASIAAIFARENSQGIFFDDQDTSSSEHNHQSRQESSEESSHATSVVSKPDGISGEQGDSAEYELKNSDDTSQKKRKSPKIGSAQDRASHLKIIK